MIAKYRGRCIICGGIIKPGDQIGWQAGHGAWHKACDNPIEHPAFPYNTSIQDYFPENKQVEVDIINGKPTLVPVI